MNGHVGGITPLSAFLTVRCNEPDRTAARQAANRSGAVNYTNFGGARASRLWPEAKAANHGQLGSYLKVEQAVSLPECSFHTFR